MRIIVWHGCEVVQQLENDAPGPDLHVDPWADLIGTRPESAPYEVPVPYHAGLRRS